jgi:hypothetical protein
VCDISDSPYRGTIYILFSDQRNGYQDTDIWLVKSVDQGVTWSQPARVNDDDSGRHQFFPWIVVDPVTGYLYVVFYDRRETTGDATDVFMAKSHDGGETWTNFRISESSFTPVINTFFGDYIDIDAYNGVVHPIWMRMDYYYMMSVWTAVYHDTVATGVVDPGVLVPAEYSLGPNYPNPFNAQTTIPFILKRQERVRVTIFNALGQRIEILADETFSAGEHTLRWNAGGYPSGLYFYRIQAGPFTSIRKCLLLR